MISVLICLVGFIAKEKMHVDPVRARGGGGGGGLAIGQIISLRIFSRC